MKVIKYVDEHFEEVLLVLFSFVMVAVIAMQVFMRFVLGNSLSWSEELARYCFIWLVYIGISYGVKKQRHIKVDVILVLLKERWRIILGIIANLFFLGFAIFVIVVGYGLVEQQMGYGQTSPSMKLPMYIVYAATPVGMALTSIRIIQQLVMQILTLIGKRDFTMKTEIDEVMESGEVQEKLKDRDVKTK